MWVLAMVSWGERTPDIKFKGLMRAVSYYDTDMTDRTRQNWRWTWKLEVFALAGGQVITVYVKLCIYWPAAGHAAQVNQRSARWHLTHSTQTLHSTKIWDKRGISSAAQHEVSSCINDSAKDITRTSSLKIIMHFVFLATGALTNYKKSVDWQKRD